MNLMTLNEYLALDWTIIIKKNDDGSYFGKIAELEGCMTEADTIPGLMEMIEDSKTAWISTAIQNGIEIPLPVKDDEFSGKVLLRLPKSLHREITRMATQEGVSMNTMAITLLAKNCSAIRALQAELNVMHRRMIV